MSDNEESSYRMNLRIPREQYDLMKKFGSVLGLTTDSACVKHFLTLGLQSSAGSLSAVLANGTSSEMLNIFKSMKEQIDKEATNVEQMDLIKEASKVRS